MQDPDQTPQLPPTEEPQPTGPSREECVQAMLAHALGVTVSVLGPLLMRLTRGKVSAFVNAHATEALNFQITLATVLLACWNFGPEEWFPFLLSGYFSVNAIFTVPAIIAASQGRLQRYWLSLRLID